MMTPEEYYNTISDAFNRDLRDMIRFQFEEDIGIIRDPETEEEIVAKISGEDFDEEETYAISFYELGWQAALFSLHQIGRQLVDNGDEGLYSLIMDAKAQSTEGDLNDESGTDD